MKRATASPDYVLLGTLGALLLFGLLMLSSASTVAGFEQFGDAYYFVKRQLLFGLLPGAVCFLFLLRYDYRKLSRLAFPLLVVSLVMLVLVLVPGIGERVGIARRWFRFGSVGFQPSELVKLFFVIYLAAWLSTRGKQLLSFRNTFVPFAVVLGTVVGLVALQPDLGTAAAIGLTAVGVYFLSGGRLSHFGFLAAGALIAFLVLVQVKPHAAERLSVFLHPDRDPQGIGYQINQAYLAIGSGGVIGRGFGRSHAKFLYLPEVFGDSIFAVIGEEMGFILSFLLVALYGFIFLRGFKVAQAAPDEFGRLLAGGIVIWFTGQALVNISALIGLLPLTGIPLPFVSYGSSALVTSLAAVGILGNISAQGGARA